MSDKRVLVVGTTPDYIAYIDEHYRDRALFVTDVSHRRGGSEVVPDAASEIVCVLSETEKVISGLREHLRHYRQTLTGVTCYDCEWLELASVLALEAGLSYSSRQSIQLSRNKYLTKQRWSEAGVRCPHMRLIKHSSEAVQFFEQLGGTPIVLKPLSGSGSELTFQCRDEYDIVHSFHQRE